MGVLEQNSRRRMFLGQDGNQLTLLMIILAVVFVLFKFAYIILRIIGKDETAYHDFIFSWAQLPGNFSTFLTRPWTLLTYPLAQFSVLEMIGDLLWLWSFGYILQDLSGNNKIIPLFIYGFLTGGVVFMLVSYTT